MERTIKIMELARKAIENEDCDMENEIFEELVDDPDSDPIVPSPDIFGSQSSREATLTLPDQLELDLTTLENTTSKSCTTEENNETVGRKKKGRKRLYGGQDRKDRKACKYTHTTYFNYKKEEVAAKTFSDVHCGCVLKCQQNVPPDVRQKEYNNFIELGSYDAQNLFIASKVVEKEKKRAYSNALTSKRNFTRVYKLNQHVVCREMFVKTLKISTKRVHTILTKMRTGNSVGDQRGKTQGGWNKTDDEKVNRVITHIKSIPKYKSHYRRSNSDSEYLPPNMTIEKMYNLYKDDCDEPVSQSTYKKIFYSKFNLKSKSLKKDTCNLCDSLNIQIQNSVNDDGKQSLIDKRETHIEEWTSAQRKMKEDLKLASENDLFECLTFDLEKTLPLPRIPTNIIFYKRQLWVYNCGVHSGKTGRSFCYVWVEGTAGRGAQDIGSCLIKHLDKYCEPGVEELILWSDSCGGQNRNFRMVLMLKTYLASHSSLKRIRQKFLISGHSFLPNDDDFGKIESALNRQQRLYTKEDYINVMKDCKKKNALTVEEMQKSDFVGTQNVEKTVINRKKSLNSEKVSWLKTREIELLKEKPFSIFLKSSFDGEPIEIDIKKKTRGSCSFKRSDLVQLWPEGKAIAEEKLKDLKSIFHLIPNDALPFYSSLFCSSNSLDDLEGFGSTPDFEIEEIE